MGGIAIIMGICIIIIMPIIWLIRVIIGNNRKLLIKRLKRSEFDGLIDFSFKDANRKFKDDLEIVKIAVNYSPSNFKYTSERIRGDENIVLEIIEINVDIIEYSLIKTDKIFQKALALNGNTIRYCPDSYKKNRSIVISALNNLKNGRYGILGILPFEMRCDKEVVLLAVKNNGGDLSNAVPSLQFDSEVVLSAVKQNGDSLKFAHGFIKDNIEIVTQAVKSENFQALKYASERLKNDREIVMLAIKSSADNFIYASESLKNDREIVKLAIERSEYNLKYASIILRKDFELCLMAVKYHYQAFEHVSEFLKNDLDFVLASLDTNHQVSIYLSEEMKIKPAIKRKIATKEN
jgi:hypothetical protein